jgi:hypothetical protein
MKQWVMSTQDFRTLLETEQDFRCALTGLELTPETVTIAHKTPLRKVENIFVPMFTSFTSPWPSWCEIIQRTKFSLSAKLFYLTQLRRI